MKAARIHGIGDIRVGEEPEPGPAAGEELVRVGAVGLCGSDMHWYAEAGIGDSRLDHPLVLGHEIAGTIDGGPRDGRRVALDPAIPCEHCEMCRSGHRNLCPRVRFAGHGACDGGLREALAWPSALLHPLPDGMSDSAGAMLEPLGVALHAIDLAHLRLGTTAAVVGCGPIGLLLVQVVRLAGATRVLAADPLPHRRAAAERVGADEVIDPDTSDSWASAVPGGVDVAFEVAGTDAAVDECLHAARPGGRVLLLGIPDDDRTTFRASLARRKGVTITLVRRMKDTYPRAIELVSTGLVEVESLVTAEYPLSEVDKAFDHAAARRGLKVVVRPSA